MSGQASMCIMFKCHTLLYVELNKVHVYTYSYGIVKGSTIFRYDLIDRLCCKGYASDDTWRICESWLQFSNRLSEVAHETSAMLWPLPLALPRLRLR